MKVDACYIVTEAQL